MGKLIVAIAIVAAVAFAWHQGWIGEWLGAAADKVDSGADSMRSIRRDATKKHGD